MRDFLVLAFIIGALVAGAWMLILVVNRPVP